MTEITTSENEIEHIDPIEVIYQGECQSLSGRSVLAFAIGRNQEDGTLHLAITGNSGGGMWCKNWAPAIAIQDIVLGAQELTAKSFHVLHQGKSINTGGFALSALKEIGLVQVSEANTRLHEHTPAMTFEKAVAAYMASHQAAPPKRRKAKEG